jgi:hypothetical protein
MAALAGEGAALHLREERQGRERAGAVEDEVEDAAPSRSTVEGEEVRTIRDLGLAR